MTKRGSEYTFLKKKLKVFNLVALLRAIDYDYYN